jgi:shikimate 5-dehydrogenase
MEINSVMLPGKVDRSTIDHFLRNLRGSGLKGLTVEMPFMTNCIPHMDWTDTRSNAIGALNLVVCSHGKLYGYNTELYAMVDVLREYLGNDDPTVLVIGCGIGGKEAAMASRMLKAKTIVAGPTFEGTKKIMRPLDPSIISVTYGSLTKDKRDYQVIINTLPPDLSISSTDSSLTVADVIRDLEPKVGLDITRSLLWTPFLSAVESRGGVAIPATEVLTRTIVRNQKLLLGEDIPPEMIEDILSDL